MSISYSGITSYGKMTLPSVESWGSSMNILKDPPKSIHTRRKDKVGMTSFITEEIDAARDRACEAIRVYARGSNPAVSVMYSNNGTVGGAHMGAASGAGQTERMGTAQVGAAGRAEASLPYKIMRDGAFRPPVRTQRQLMPLSRQPRAPTNIEARPDFPDWTKKLQVCGDAKDYRQVKTETHNLSTTVPKTCKKVRGMEAPYEIKYFTKENLAAEAFTNKNDRRIQSEHRSHMDTSRHIQVCLDVGEANTAKQDLTKYKRAVENTIKNKKRNVPISAWECGSTPAKNYTAYPNDPNVCLKPTTDRGGQGCGYMSGAGKPMIHA